VLAPQVEKLTETASRQQIDNSMQGLRAYLSALNIRNKCKHPLFLALRFDSCVGLLYDRERARHPLADDNAFYSMMEALSSVDSLSLRPPGGTPTELPPFVIAVRASHTQASCVRTDCPVHGQSVQLTSLFALPHASTLPPAYLELCELQITQVRRTYCRLYCSHNSPGGAAARVPPQVCDVCDTAHLLPSLPPLCPSEVAAQRQAVALRASLRQLSSATEGLDECPEQEWEHELLVLAEAMSQLCHTRSSAEIVAFMKGEVAEATKRMPAARRASSEAHAHEHTHDMTQQHSGCPGCSASFDLADVDLQHEHVHDSHV